MNIASPRNKPASIRHSMHISLPQCFRASNECGMAEAASWVGSNSRLGSSSHGSSIGGGGGGGRGNSVFIFGGRPRVGVFLMGILGGGGGVEEDEDGSEVG